MDDLSRDLKNLIALYQKRIEMLKEKIEYLEKDMDFWKTKCHVIVELLDESIKQTDEYRDLYRELKILAGLDLECTVHDILYVNPHNLN